MITFRLPPSRPPWLWIFLLLPLGLQAQLPTARIVYDPGSGQFSLPYPPPIAKAPKASKAASWGIYWWEFGDGHWSFAPKPIHHYAQRGTYRVKLHLTPFYAVTPAMTIEETISAPGRGQATDHRYDLRGKEVKIWTNSSRDIVPGQDIQVFLSYHLPAALRNRAGYLFLFFDRGKELGVKFSPLRQTDARFYRGEQEMSSVEHIAEQLDLEARNYVRSQINSYHQQAVFRTAPVTSDTVRTIFLSYRADERLAAHQDKNKELTLLAVWVPDRTTAFNSKLYTDEYTCQLLAVRDPNRIRVTPRVAYFHKKHPQTFQYHIDFQNLAEGSVDRVRIALAIPKGLDPHTIGNITTDPPLDSCYRANGSVAESCWNFQLKEGLVDSAIFTLYGLGLEGKGDKGLFESKASTKGWVKFTVESNEERNALLTNRASIVFQDVEAVPTNYTRTHFRRKGIYLHAGQLLQVRGMHLDNRSDGPLERLSLGLGAYNAPLGSGLAYGLELGYTNLHQGRTYQDTVITGRPQAVIPNLLITSDQARIHYLEPRIWAGYQLYGLGRAYAGLGFSLPLYGRLTVDSDLYRGLDTDNEPILRAHEETSIGLLGKNDLEIFGQQPDIGHSPGLSLQAGLEFGRLPNLALGLISEWRYYPKYYHGACCAVFNTQVYVRLELAAFGKAKQP